MIDLSCSDCGRDNQDVSPASTKEYHRPQHSQQQHVPNKNQQQFSNSHKEPNHSGTSNYQYLTPVTGTTSAPFNFQPRISYSNHNHLQHHQSPLIVHPHLLLAGSAGNGSAQFTLTPDARACVTATYLCVLIVNNTWLDCNASNSNPSTSFSDLSEEGSATSPQQQHQAVQYLAAKTHLRPVTTPVSILGVYDFSSSAPNLMSPQMQQLAQDRDLSPIQHHQQQQQQHLHHQQQQHHAEQQNLQHQLMQQQQQFQEQQAEPTTTSGGVECKCNQDVDDQQLSVLLPTSMSECHFRCANRAGSSNIITAVGVQQTQPTPNVNAASAMLVDQTNQMSSTSPTSSIAPTAATVVMLSPSSSSPASSMTLAPQQTTVGPTGGKMNPLDVTFLLYTRYHRDLAMNAAVNVAAVAAVTSVNVNSGGTGSSSVATVAAAAAERSLVNAAEVIDLTNETTLNESHLNSSLPIKIIIHGFGSGGRRPWVTDMVYKLLDYEDVNVIVVDWEKGAALPNYVQAAGNTRLVGHKIACLIKSINAKYGLTGNTYHLIGFSLGAHVAGFAGMEIRNSTSMNRLWINRITGLDPASPLFEGYEANDRLDPSDAQFVDVIHSNGDGVLRGGFGSLQPMGHVDFYPNGGRVQVGCNSVLLSALSDIIYGKWQSLCNHRRALNFFMDSFEFNKCKFRSFNCDSYESYLKGDCFDCGYNNEKCSYMGYLANYSKGRGKMYLTTHEDAPFCANQFMIKILGTKGHKTHWGKIEVTLVTVDGKNESFWLSSINQQSNNHESLSGNLKEHSQHSMQSLIVAHSTLVNFTQILLRYTKYKGWIYSGDESWSIDKVLIADSDGQVKSYCGANTVLESHITTRLNLEPGNCTVVETQSNSISVNSSTQQQPPRQQEQSQQQQQPQQQQLQSQQQQQQQQQQQHSARQPRLFASIIQSQSPEPHNSQPLSHMRSYQRMSTPNDRQQQQQQQNQFGINFNNIPVVSF